MAGRFALSLEVGSNPTRACIGECLLRRRRWSMRLSNPSALDVLRPSYVKTEPTVRPTTRDAAVMIVLAVILPPAL
jgi:hypothetical protein